MIRRPPNSTRTDTLFPYTTRFRSDGGVAGDGVDRDERALEPSAPVGSRCGEALQQRRYGGGLVRLGVDRLLSEDEAAGGGEGRDEVQRRGAGAPVEGQATRLHISGHTIEAGRARYTAHILYTRRQKQHHEPDHTQPTP